MVTNPLQYLSYIAGITERIDLATMVVVLPWHNPVRVAEDVNMLDTFLGPDREIICGVGRGLGRREYEGLGIDQAEARERFDESLRVLQQLLATGKCDFEGEHYNIKGLRLRPQPDRDLSPNLWCAGGTGETVEIIAKHGVRPLVIPTQSLGLSLETAKKYAKLHGEAGYAPTKNKLAVWTDVAETEAEAQENAERYMVECADSALRHYELRGSHLGNIKGYESYGAVQKALAEDPSPFLRGFYNEHPWGTTGTDHQARNGARARVRHGRDFVHLQIRQHADREGRKQHAPVRQGGLAGTEGNRNRADLDSERRVKYSCCARQRVSTSGGRIHFPAL